MLILIEKSGGPESLDLSGKEFAELDLSAEAIRIEMDRLNSPYDDPPYWYAPGGGLNLCGAVLHSAIFKGCRLGGADFRNSDLRGADFSAADVSHALFSGADLTGANFATARIDGVNLAEAKAIDGIYLADAILVNSPIRRDQLKLGMGETQEKHYLRAKEAFLALRNNYLSLGRYLDASWAYVKERQMERLAVSPFAREKGSQTRIDKWLSNYIAGLSCGYGERPIMPIVWALIAIVTFSVLYVQPGEIISTTQAPLGWLDYVQYSLAAFGTIGSPGMSPGNEWAKLFTSLEAVFGISMLALLMFTLGNRISRS